MRIWRHGALASVCVAAIVAGCAVTDPALTEPATPSTAASPTASASAPPQLAAAWCEDSGIADGAITTDPAALLPSRQGDAPDAGRVDGVVTGTVLSVEEAVSEDARRIFRVTMAVDAVVDHRVGSTFAGEASFAMRYRSDRSAEDLLATLSQSPTLLAFLFVPPATFDGDTPVWEDAYGPETLWQPQGVCPLLFGVEADGSIVPVVTAGPHLEFPGLPATLADLAAAAPQG